MDYPSATGGIVMTIVWESKDLANTSGTFASTMIGLGGFLLILCGGGSMANAGRGPGTAGGLALLGLALLGLGFFVILYAIRKQRVSGVLATVVETTDGLELRIQSDIGLTASEGPFRVEHGAHEYRIKGVRRYVSSLGIYDADGRPVAHIDNECTSRVQHPDGWPHATVSPRGFNDSYCNQPGKSVDLESLRKVLAG